MYVVNITLIHSDVSVCVEISWKVQNFGNSRARESQICPGLNANEIQIPHDNNDKVSSLVKSQQHTQQFCQIWSDIRMSNNPAKYEVLNKNTCVQYPGRK